MQSLKNTDCKKNLIHERDELEQKLNETLELKDSIQNKQTADFNELLCRDDTLCRDYNRSQVELENYKNEHVRLLSENSVLDKKLNEHRKDLEVLNCHKLAQLQATEDLQKQYLETTGTKLMLQNKLLETRTKKELADKDLICVQHKITEQINIHAELDKTVSKEQNEKERLVSSINNLKIDIDKLKKSLQTEEKNQQHQLNEKAAQLDTIKKKKNEKCEEMKTHKCQITALNTKIKVLQENHSKEKCNLDKKVSELTAEMNALTLKIDASNAKLCDFRSKSTVLKNHLDNQENMIKLMESTKEKMTQVLKKIKNTAETLTETNNTLSQLREKDKNTYEMKLVSKNQEKCKLKELIKIQLEQITKLQSQIFDNSMNDINMSANKKIYLQ